MQHLACFTASSFIPSVGHAYACMRLCYAHAVIDCSDVSVLSDHTSAVVEGDEPV